MPLVRSRICDGREIPHRAERVPCYGGDDDDGPARLHLANTAAAETANIAETDATADTADNVYTTDTAAVSAAAMLQTMAAAGTLLQPDREI